MSTVAKGKTIAWFRNDLRIQDNILLSEAKECFKKGDEILCLYCFDPSHFSKTPFQSTKSHKYRTRFLIESVMNLRENLKSIQSDLLIAYGKPEDIIPTILQGDQKVRVLVQNEPAYEEKLVEKRAVEVGNIFSLGTKYSTPFDLKYKSELEVQTLF